MALHPANLVHWARRSLIGNPLAQVLHAFFGQTRLYCRIWVYHRSWSHRTQVGLNLDYVLYDIHR